MNKCLWCGEELVKETALFCCEDKYSNRRPDWCGLAYIKSLKYMKSIKVPLTEFEEGVLTLVKKFKLANLVSEPVRVTTDEEETPEEIEVN